MLYKQLGKTGKDISCIGAGGMRFKDTDDIEKSAEILSYAHSKGINYFDTAPGYCNNKSEKIVACAISELKREEYYVASKSMAKEPGEFRRSLENSLKKLNIEKLDFFYIWYICSLEDWENRKRTGIIDAVIKAKEEGLIDNIAVSTHMNGEEIRQLLNDDVAEIILLGYNILNFPYREDGVCTAAKKDVGIITMNPLSGGIIPQNPDMLNFIRQDTDNSVVEAALRFNISNPSISCALVGFSSKSEVDEAVRAVEQFTPYKKTHIESIKKQISTNFHGLCTACGYCMPCPHGVEIVKLMDTYNQKILQKNSGENIKAVMKNRLLYHWDNLPPENALKCTQCGKCEKICTQKLPIIKRLELLGELSDHESN
ncbi:MAG: aldo/keto reductase, partial [Verrucomicrobiota bacterium]|nr:aldo/keto reductase [Verrucomicrobiota bacterium]